MRLFKAILTMLVLTFLIPSFVLAEEEVIEEWVSDISNIDSSSNNTKVIEIDSSGNVYAITTFGDATKVDKDGNIVWKGEDPRLYLTGCPSYSFLRPNDIVIDSQGEVIVTGGVRCHLGWGQYDGYTLTYKYDSNGQVLWARLFVAPGGGWWRPRNYGVAVDVDAQDNVFVAAYGGRHTMKINTIKLDKDGNELWHRTYWDGAASQASDIVVDAAGDVYVLGSVSTQALWNRDYGLLKYDTDGNLLWEAINDEEQGDVPTELALGPGGNLYVNGTTISNKDRKTWIMTYKIDSEGNLLWSNALESPAGPSARSATISVGVKVDSNGYVYVGGTVKDVYMGTAPKFYAAKVDPSGNTLWEKVGVVGEKMFAAYARDVDIDKKGNVYLVVDSNLVRGRGDALTTIALDSDDGDQLWIMQYGDGQAWHRSYASAIAVDSSGNVYSGGRRFMAPMTAVVIKYRGSDIDPPEITISSPAAGDHLISESITIDFTVTDDGSGVDTVSAALDGYPVSSGDTVALYTLGAGSHTLDVEASDKSGNVGSETVTFNVIVTADALADLIRILLDAGLIDNAGVANALIAKVGSGSTKALLNHIDAQDGKHIDSEAADILRAAIAAL